MTGEGIERRRALPAGAVLEMRRMADGWPVRTLCWPGRAGGPGSILLLTGRGDFIEKYCETLHDLTDAGWGVASFDWRGQGLSGRQGDNATRGHSPGFENWVSDLGELTGWFRASLPGPHHAVAHSMGGHLLLRRLAVEGNDFARVVLLSPMLGVAARPLGPALARRLAGGMVRAGRAGAFIAGGGPFASGAAGSARQRLLTSDPERHGDEAWWVRETPELALGSPTWGWLDAAFRSLAVLFAGGLERVRTPVLTLIPAVDGLVDNAAARRGVAMIPGARLAVIAGAGHELLRERPAVRAAVLAQVTRFLVDAA